MLHGHALLELGHFAAQGAGGLGGRSGGGDLLQIPARLGRGGRGLPGCCLGGWPGGGLRTFEGLAAALPGRGQRGAVGLQVPGRLLAGGQVQELRVDLVDEAAGFAGREVAPAVAAHGIGERAALFGPGQGHIEQPAFLLQVGAGLHRHQVGKEVLLQAYDVHVGELQALGAVDGHQAHPVLVVGVVVVGVGEQGHVDQEVGQGARGVGALIAFAELLHAVQQFLDVLVAADALGGAVRVEVLQKSGGAGDVFAQLVRALALEHGLEAADHGHEVDEPPLGPFVETQLVQVLQQRVPDGQFPFSRGHHQLVHGGLADAAGGVVHHALEGLLVARVAGQAEVAQQVLHLLALVEAEAAVDAVGDVELAQGLLHGAALGVGAVQDGEGAVGQLVLHARFEDVVRHEGPLLVVAHAPPHADGVALLVLRPDGLLDLVAVLVDQAVGRAHDGLRAAVVLLQLEEGVVGVVVPEVEDVLDAGPAERVDALAVVAHHGEVLVAGGHGAHDVVLGQVGVLVLVHQDVLEALLVLQHHVRMVAEQDVGVEQQVVEVHGGRPEAALGVLAVDLAELLASGCRVIGHQLHVVQVLLGADQVVLGDADAAVDEVGLVQLVVQPPFLHDGAQQGAAVVGVVDGEVARIAQLAALGPEDAGEDAVEGAHPEASGLRIPLWAKQFCDPLLHLPGRLVGEGEGQDTEGVHPLGQQVGDADGEHPGLARPGAGDHQVGPRGVQDGLALGLVQSFEMLHGQATKVAVPARAPGACG